MRILGIETSCDETAVAVVDDQKEVLGHIVLSQIEEHAPYAGVVPEIAARAHIEVLDEIVRGVLKEAKIDDLSELDAIAVTAGPGLIGGVIVGVMTAKALASAAKLPIVAVNHLEGHALVARMFRDINFPYLLLLVSGGHCQYLSVKGVGDYTRLGTTIDDAVGEAFDKVAKMLKLGYPGGPIVEKLAKDGDEDRFELPRPLIGKKGCDFSFSGLKTAVKREVDKIGNDITDQDKADICASFQKTVGNILKAKTKAAIEMFKADNPEGSQFVVSGGVAANQYLRKVLTKVANEHNMEMIAPPLKLCTDNGVMIAWAGLERFKGGEKDDIAFVPRARWPLDTKT